MDRAAQHDVSHVQLVDTGQNVRCWGAVASGKPNAQQSVTAGKASDHRWCGGRSSMAA